MRGFPKFLNTKQDYLNCLTMFPEETKKALQTLLDNRFNWFDVAILEEDVTELAVNQRIIEADGEKMLQEEKEDPNARIFLLGFTVEEVEELIKWLN